MTLADTDRARDLVRDGTPASVRGLIHAAGYDGPIDTRGHVEDADVEDVLRKNYRRPAGPGRWPLKGMR